MTGLPLSEPHRKGWRQVINFWNIVFALCFVVIAILLIAPLSEVFVVGFVDPQTGVFTLGNYARVLSHPYYVGALRNSILVGVGGMVGACLIGVPLAYFVARFKVRGAASFPLLPCWRWFRRPLSVLIRGFCFWAIMAGSRVRCAISA